MNDNPPTWDDVRRIADELELEIHLAGMDARDRWNQLQPRLAEIEKSIETAGERAGKFVSAQITSLATTLRELRAELSKQN